MPRKDGISSDVASTVFENLQLGDEFDSNTMLPTGGDQDGGGSGWEDDGGADDGQGGQRTQQDDLDDLNALGDDGQQPRQQQQRQPDNRRQQQQPQGVRPDAKGNLVDANGQIVAKAGGERRLYTNLQTANRTIQAHEGRINDLSTRLSKALDIARDLVSEREQRQGADQAMEQLGIKAEDRIKAFQLYSEMNADPKGTLKKLLTRAVASGITPQELGITNGAPSFDSKDFTSILQSALDERLKPLTDAQKQARDREAAQARENEAVENAKVELNTFLSENPDARNYLGVIQRVLQQPQFANRSYGEVWARIQLNLMRNPPRNQRQRRNPPPRSLPNGRRMPASGIGEQSEASEIADPRRSYDDILNEVMRENA